MYLVPAPQRVPHNVDHWAEAAQACMVPIVPLLGVVVVIRPHFSGGCHSNLLNQLGTVQNNGIGIGTVSVFSVCKTTIITVLW